MKLIEKLLAWSIQGSVKAVWLGGVQINGQVHLVTEENNMEPSLNADE